LRKKADGSISFTISLISRYGSGLSAPDFRPDRLCCTLTPLVAHLGGDGVGKGDLRVARNDQIVRILTVAHALSQTRRGVSLKALAERHGWPWRTVYRDVDALERAGFPIEKEDGRHRMTDGWKSPHLPGIEPDEILALYAMRTLADSWRTTALGRPLDRLWMKLTASGSGQGALMPLMGEPWFAVRSPVGIDYRAHDKTIATFERAVRDHLAVTCRYRAASTRQTTARVIEPGELYWDPGLESLYVIGWCRLRQDVRVFALHRFLAASLTDERFTARREARSKAALRGAFRVWRAEHVETVRVWFAAEVADEIRERTWGPGQRIEEDTATVGAGAGDGGLVLTLEVAGLAEIERWVLGYGGAAEVLEPPALRRSVAERTAEAAKRYEGGAHGPKTAQGLGARRPAVRKATKANVLSRADNRRG
jgi:proteasome accessory factor B